MISLSRTALSDVALAAADAAREAGTIIQEVRGSGARGVVEKADASPVTLADQRSDELLKARLGRLLPGAAWLSEESADDSSRRANEFVWVVDPLDGTKEFIEGVPQYAVAIALLEKNEPVLGIVHNPVTGEVFSAIRGEGAMKDGEPVVATENGAMLASRSEMKRGEFEPFGDWTIEPIGSIALKLAFIASGRGAVTLSRGPKWEWDVCAGALIVQQAGGRATDMFGEPFRFNNSFPKVRGILAGAPKAFERALTRLRDIGGSDRMAELAAPGT